MGWITSLPTEVLVVLATGLITFFTTKRKYIADSKNLENEVTKTIFETYKEEFDSMQKRINEYVSRIEDLEKKVNILVKENNTLKDDLDKFEKMYGKQKKPDKIIGNDFVKIDTDSEA